MVHYTTRHEEIVLNDDVWRVLDALQTVGRAGEYQRAGENVWDVWQRLALKIGVNKELALLGRAVMREFYQHAWEAYGDEVSTEAAPDMIALALGDPHYADARWTYLLESDGEWRRRTDKMPKAIRKSRYE